jgi:phosphohistidine swiveling domain-containing protein
MTSTPDDGWAVNVISLTAVDAGMVHLVGGKAAGLARMIKAGERVPAGFCVTTTAYRAGVIPEAELVQAYERLGGGAVAVRSSATAEDLPDASFAGQQDTFLGVAGAAALIDAVRKCWDSLHTARAIAYRGTRQIDEAQMAVLVQRMIDPSVAGVLFTANPITGRRTEMVVDAAPGLGTAVVDGSVVPEHYILNQDPPAVPKGGCLNAEQLRDLHAAGQRLQELFGSPQDIEWALDRDGSLWLLQSRPITTLFPLPPQTGRPSPRVYLELGGQFQGVFQPFTPMGISALRAIAATVSRSFGAKTDPLEGFDRVVDIGGRLYVDLTDIVRRKGADKWLPKMVEADLGPRVRAVVEQILADPRFSPQPGRPTRRGGTLKPMLRIVPRGLAGVTRSLASPAAARSRAFRAVDDFKDRTAAPSALNTAADRLSFVEGMLLPAAQLERMIWPLMAGILAAAAPAGLLKTIASVAEVNTVWGGMPHNVTVEMDLAIWRLPSNAGEHRELLRNTSPANLATMYRAGTLPDIGLSEFLDRYGHRAAAEIDIGIPRWDEDPSPVFAAMANYLRITDPEQAPDRRFERAAANAEAMLRELVRRARRRRPVRGLLAGFFMRRARSLAGLREIGKFAGLYPLRQMRRQLLLVGAELASVGLLARAEDIMFLSLQEVRAAVHQRADHRALVVSRRDAYGRELRRAYVPVALFSDGTDVEALKAPEIAEKGKLSGMAAAPGTATGPARVIRDPADAHIEPGEILVTPTTDPGWTPLFLTAAGLVTEIGAPLAHGPTVAREYGIPAVICVRNATHEIRTGQVITVDGAAGTVTIDS